MEYTEDQFLFPLVSEPRSRWEKAGLSPRQERSFNRVSTLLVAMFVTGWTYTVATASANGPPLDQAEVTPLTAAITRSPLASDAPSETPHLSDASARQFVEDFARQVGGASGAVRVKVLKPGETLHTPALPQGAAVELRPTGGTGGGAVAGGNAPAN